MLCFYGVCHYLLWCAVLCCAALCYAMPCYAVLCFAMLCYAMLSAFSATSRKVAVIMVLHPPRPSFRFVSIFLPTCGLLSPFRDHRLEIMALSYGENNTDNILIKQHTATKVKPLIPPPPFLPPSLPPSLPHTPINKT